MVNSQTGISDNIRLAANIEQAMDGSAVALILTEWPEFTRANWAKLIDLMHTPCLVDARNVLDRRSMIELGYRYDDLGRI